MMGLSGSSPKQPSTTAQQIDTPLGDITNSNGSTQFVPTGGQTYSPFQPNILTSENQDIGNIVSSLPTSFNVNDAYNNPFYQSTANLLDQPITQQYQQSQNNLNNSLNAKNQLGSSYDALSNYYLNQNYSNQLNNANNTARQDAFNAYNQNLNDQLGTLSALRGDMGSAIGQTYAPFTAGTQYQSQALNPLVGDATQAYNAQLNQQNNELNSALNVI